MLTKKLRARLIVGGVTLALIISGCANFPPQKATAAPQPTDTPLSPVVVPTSTPTLPPPPPTATATPAVVIVAATTPTAAPEAEPTSTAAPAEPTAAAPRPTATPLPQPKELLTNGNFEGGFATDGVAKGWMPFSSADAHSVWFDDTWDLLVQEGEHSQLISIVDPVYNDRYAGIYQTVQVLPGKTYQLSLYGLVRANTPAEQYGHRLYVGWDDNGGSDWQTVENWIELDWDQQPLVADAFTIDHFATEITPTGKSLTLFIRGHSKWPRTSEANFNLDNVSLYGVPGGDTGAEPTMPVTGRGEMNWAPLVALIALVLILFREGWLGLTGRRDGV
ncbi:MAG: hypothetical protein ACOYZ7_14255 [Chloroflexota bacterium]